MKRNVLLVVRCVSLLVLDITSLRYVVLVVVVVVVAAAAVVVVVRQFYNSIVLVVTVRICEENVKI
jgi:hypothetical protein